ncbi:hypothetical protein B0T12DRAFT_146423 [Alternaria alternata]|nr:hypothetical protein B0T12DRAFT_146423 [Alternaria alternata]
MVAARETTIQYPTPDQKLCSCSNPYPSIILPSSGMQTSDSRPFLERQMGEGYMSSSSHPIDAHARPETK